MNRQLNAPKITPILKYLIIIYGSVFLLGSILSKTSGLQLAPIFGLSVSGVLSGLIYQPFTYMFVGTGLMEVLFGCLILWFIGSELESLWGAKRFLSFVTVTSVGGGFFYLLVSGLFFSGMVHSFPLTGIAGIANALCLAYAILFPDREFIFMFLFPMKAKYFCMLLVVISLYQGVFTPGGVMAWGHLGAMVFAYLFMVFVAYKKQLNFKSPISFKRQAKKKPSHLTLVDDEKPDPTKNNKYWQ